MQNFVMKLKAFNNNHRKLVPVLIYFEIIAIVFVSIGVYIKRHLKIVVPAVVAVIAIIIAVTQLGTTNSKTSVTDTVSEASVEETTVEAAEIESLEASVAEMTDGETTSEASVADISIAEESAFDESYAETATDSTGGDSSFDENKAVETVVPEATAVETLVPEATAEETVVPKAAVEETTKPEIVDTIIPGEGTDKAVSQEAFDEFVKKYNETVGWLWFEDGRLNYPIMRADDNNKYALKDYAGNDSDTGAIFLDYRNATDFSDSNSIIYGHNMRNRTMFGALKIYKEDLGFLELHKYFQIITSEGKSRYQIFAFMDVPKNSYIYDVIGKKPSNMREYLDTIEYKTYIDTGIEPTVDDQIVMLSSCTKSDELYFVIFGVKVSEE